MYSDARGSVKITSADPRWRPALRFNYLSTAQDRREWAEAIHVARDILNQPAFGQYNDGELRRARRSRRQADPGLGGRDAETALHPSCTCKMGTDDRPVLDPPA